MRGLCAAIVCIALVTAHGIGHAQESAAADAAFKEGRRLMKARKYAEACPKFEISQKLDPATGTLMNLAECYEDVGRLASAWAAYNEVADRAHREGSAARESKAKARSAALEPKLAKLTLRVDETAKGMTLTRDGLDVLGLVGIAVPVDPGDHVVEADALGQHWSQHVTVGNDAKATTVTVPKFWTVEPPVAVTPPPKTPAPMVTDEAPPRPGRTRRMIGWVVMGAGAVALGAAGIFALGAKSTWNDSRAHCNSANVCDQTGFDQVKSAESKGTTATILAGGGIAAVATGLVLYLTAPSHAPDAVPAARIDVGPGYVGAVYGRSF